MELKAISSHLFTLAMAEETDPYLTRTFFHVIFGRNEVPPELPFLQGKQPQFPHLLLTGQISRHFTSFVACLEVIYDDSLFHDHLLYAQKWLLYLKGPGLDLCQTRERGSFGLFGGHF